MEFKCSACEYKSERRLCVVKHINRKIPCNEGILEVVTVQLDIKCYSCNKEYSSWPNLKRHLSTCKVKKNNLIEENRILKEKLAISEALNKKPSTVIGTQNINIHLSPWNDPRLPDDVEKYYREAVKKIFLAVPTLIKYIHFNADFPENHNISIKNGRSKTAKVYNGKEWETVDEDQLIRTLINDYEHTLEDYAEDKNPKYIASIKEIKDRDTEEKVYDDLHNEVKRVIYDRNHMIKIKN
jgi:hypothetical protein